MGRGPEVPRLGPFLPLNFQGLRYVGQGQPGSNLVYSIGARVLGTWKAIDTLGNKHLGLVWSWPRLTGKKLGRGGLSTVHPTSPHVDIRIYEDL